MLSVSFLPRHCDGTARPAAGSGGISPDTSLKRSSFSVTGSIVPGRRSQSARQHPTCLFRERCKVRWTELEEGGGRGGNAVRNALSSGAPVSDPQPYGDGGSSPIKQHQHHHYTRHRHRHYPVSDWKHASGTSHDHARHSGHKTQPPPPGDLQL